MKYKVGDTIKLASDDQLLMRINRITGGRYYYTFLKHSNKHQINTDSNYNITCFDNATELVRKGIIKLTGFNTYSKGI